MPLTQNISFINWKTWILYMSNAYQKQLSRARTSNYILQILWDVITYPCPWYLRLAHKSIYHHCCPIHFRHFCHFCSGEDKLTATELVADDAKSSCSGDIYTEQHRTHGAHGVPVLGYCVTQGTDMVETHLISMLYLWKAPGNRCRCITCVCHTYVG